jgi:ketosteroid isomerase-like protein
MRPAVRLLLPLLVGAACQPASPPAAPNGATPAIRQAIQAADEEWSRAYIAGDTTAMRQLYATDLVSMRAAAPDILGPDAMVADLARGFRSRADTVLHIETMITTLDHSGDLAWESGQVTFASRPRDSLNVASHFQRYKYITFWQRGPDGRWRIRRDLAVPDLPPQS